MSDDVRFEGLRLEGWDETELQRRERILGQVRHWCEQARIDAPHEGLSDESAVLIAAGRLDDETRAILVNRRRGGRDIPWIGGFGALRQLTDECVRFDRKAARLQPGPLQMLFKYRATELAKRLQAKHRTVVMPGPHFANGVRAMRRERRIGVHLDLEQREALFAALQRTPAPLVASPVDRVRNIAVAAAAERVARLAEKTPMAAVAWRAAEGFATSAGTDDNVFADRYDTLLYLAGSLYDRINGSTVWQSDHFAVQRAQLDLADELIQIALDTVALRGITGELAAAQQMAKADTARAQVHARQQALAPVWDQLLERVAALARIGDLLSKAEDQLQSMTAVARTMSLDSRIDDLIARSGNRELSAANTHFVGDQFGDVDELMISYQNLLYNDILSLTSRGTT